MEQSRVYNPSHETYNDSKGSLESPNNTIPSCRQERDLHLNVDVVIDVHLQSWYMIRGTWSEINKKS